MYEDELPFAIEQWSADGVHLKRTLARAGNVITGRIIMDAIAGQTMWEGQILLRHKTRVIEEWKPPHEPARLDTGSGADGQ